jgi:RNA polymerase sigma factor (TIGR02999 family)
MPGEITELLGQLRRGDTAAESKLAALVYEDLYRIAQRYMRRERREHSLQATVLVHDAYLRLVNQDEQNWQNRSHFFAVAARLMRQILIDHARMHKAQKRGGGGRLPLDDVLLISDDRLDEILAVDEALTRLAERDGRLARIVELRFFGGLTEDEIAEALGVSPRTVKRDWNVAKAWLSADLSDDGAKAARTR